MTQQKGALPVPLNAGTVSTTDTCLLIIDKVLLLMLFLLLLLRSTPSKFL
jgi:hypothetical protein